MQMYLTTTVCCLNFLAPDELRTFANCSVISLEQANIPIYHRDWLLSILCLLSKPKAPIFFSPLGLLCFNPEKQ